MLLFVSLVVVCVLGGADSFQLDQDWNRWSSMSVRPPHTPRRLSESHAGQSNRTARIMLRGTLLCSPSLESWWWTDQYGRSPCERLQITFSTEFYQTQYVRGSSAAHVLSEPSEHSQPEVNILFHRLQHEYVLHCGLVVEQ